MLIALYRNRIKNTDFRTINHIWCTTKRQPKHRRGGSNKTLSNPTEKKTWFFVVENFEFSRVVYCCTMRTIPTNYTEAVNSLYVDNRILAMRREFDSRVENNTFEWQKAPRNKNIIGRRCFFTIKSKRDGSYKYKARFVAKGYSEIYGKDNRETFAQTTNMASIKLLLQIPVQNDLLIHHIDVKCAYLNAPLDYEIYVELP